MNKSFIVRLIVATLVVVIGTLTFLVSPALAGNFALSAGTSVLGTATTADVTPTVTPTSTATPPPFLTTDLLIPSLVVLFAACLLLIFVILAYVYNIQKKYYAITQSLSQMGVGVKAISIDTFVKPQDRMPAVAEAAIGKLKIDGLGVVTVGTPVDFTVKKESGGGSTEEAEWSIDEGDAAASVSPKKGAKVSVTPQKMGRFTLTATIKDNGTITDKGSASVIAFMATNEELPFIGQGYGSLVIAILVVFAVILLALTGTLQGEAVATLFGALLGYIFATHAAAAATSSKKSDGKPPDTSS